MLFAGTVPLQSETSESSELDGERRVCKEPRGGEAVSLTSEGTHTNTHTHTPHPSSCPPTFISLV